MSSVRFRLRRLRITQKKRKQLGLVLFKLFFKTSNCNTPRLTYTNNFFHTLNKLQKNSKTNTYPSPPRLPKRSGTDITRIPPSPKQGSWSKQKSDNYCVYFCLDHIISITIIPSCESRKALFKKTARAEDRRSVWSGQFGKAFPMMSRKRAEHNNNQVSFYWCPDSEWNPPASIRAF